MRRVFESLTEASGSDLVVTVLGVEGSTYCKEGARILLRSDGSTVGALSGGCLEADLFERLRPRWPLCSAERMLYDAHGDEPWALPLGCGGRMELLLEPVTELHRRLAAEWLAGRPCGVVVSPHFGSIALRLADRSWHGLPEPDFPEDLLQTGGIRRRRDGWILLAAPPQPRLWLVGAGPEAAPLAAAASAVGWRVRLVERRAHLADPAQFPGVEAVERLEPEALPGRIGAGGYAVLMHHHLELDRLYLEALLPAPLRYLGVLGPRQRTLDLMGVAPVPAHLYAPVGLDTGGEGPEAIAYSILAEIEAVRHGRTGGHLRDRSV